MKYHVAGDVPRPPPKHVVILPDAPPETFENYVALLRPYVVPITLTFVGMMCLCAVARALFCAGRRRPGVQQKRVLNARVLRKRKAG